ncbi:hypothetical protein GPJ56_004001 [Histomonas meleagridis]|nr:hypothetical protein GPJ56_004001 [Histomonas meleagridis]
MPHWVTPAWVPHLGATLVPHTASATPHWVRTHWVRRTAHRLPPATGCHHARTELPHTGGATTHLSATHWVPHTHLPPHLGATHAWVTAAHWVPRTGCHRPGVATHWVRTRTVATTLGAAPGPPHTWVPPHALRVAARKVRHTHQVPRT